jgi:hypothetical protein
METTFGKYKPGDLIRFDYEWRKDDIMQDRIAVGPYHDGIWIAYETVGGNIVREYEILEGVTE